MMRDAGDRPHPLGREAADTVFGLVENLGLRGPRGTLAARVAIAVGAALLAGVQLVIVGTAAVLVDEPMLVPSVGPTVFLLVFAPQLRVARPRNVVGGHAIAIVCGVVGRMVFGLYGSGPALSGALSPVEMAAAVVAVMLTALVASVLGLTHPPSAATALVVGLGLIERPWSLTALAGGVLLVVVVGAATARAAGLRLGGHETG